MYGGRETERCVNEQILCIREQKNGVGEGKGREREREGELGESHINKYYHQRRTCARKYRKINEREEEFEVKSVVTVHLA